MWESHGPNEDPSHPQFAFWWNGYTDDITSKILHLMMSSSSLSWWCSLCSLLNQFSTINIDRYVILLLCMCWQVTALCISPQQDGCVYLAICGSCSQCLLAKSKRLGPGIKSQYLFDKDKTCLQYRVWVKMFFNSKIWNKVKSFGNVWQTGMVSALA